MFLYWLSPCVYQLLGQLAPLWNLASLYFHEMCLLLSTYCHTRMHVIMAYVEFYCCQKKPHQTYCAWVAEIQGISQQCPLVTNAQKDFYADSVLHDAVIWLAPDKDVHQHALQ